MNTKLIIKLFQFSILQLFLVIISFAQDSLVTQNDSSKIQSSEDYIAYEGLDDATFEALLNPKQEEEKKAPNRIVFALKVTDEKTKAPLEAYIELTAKTKDGKLLTGEGFCNPKGIFKLNLVANSLIKVQISYGTYMPVTDVFNLIKIAEESNKDEVKKLYKLNKITVGEYINLENISFEQGQSKLVKNSYQQIDEIASMMKLSPTMIIEIAGHTDDTGSEAASLKLSKERVHEVREYLIKEHKISEKRIKEIGYGSSKPVAKGTDPESRTRNRRVEFKIIKP